MQEQAQKAGIDLNAVMADMLGDKEMEAIMSKPHVQKVMQEASKNPTSLFKHMRDPDIRKLVSKMQDLQQNHAK